MQEDLGTGAALDVVVDLVRAAVHDRLLDDVGSLTGGLSARGWRRHRRGGVWELAHPVALSAWTSVTPPTVSVRLDYEDDDDPLVVRAVRGHAHVRAFVAGQR
ncbi:hypothetical protein SAMN06264364_12114 [Quadrisphaera granulorum]|uniref:Uncharacterized protein n=1 Tax=Quadrisphaera granulorum TaxID=317664 RepID=A0A316AMA1_9ACTN|nr:hypothetical protein [Quadrisphaera granulorum]PWJ51137.1 hypothetical protein BXY45_12114 [Quadrisphaera granulorum]SZE97787.1 hypothetical protein SAMN06264364_12114 [Quadrisphaera granulorum]